MDVNRPALGPPRDLLEAFQEREEAFKLDGMCDEGAHNATWEELDFEERYREYLGTDEARAALTELRAALADGTDIALVCYENTDKKRCHRTILRDVLVGSGDWYRAYSPVAARQGKRPASAGRGLRNWTSVFCGERPS